MTTLLLGVPKTLASGDIVALPARAGRLFVNIDDATTIDLSVDSAFTDDIAVPAADWQVGGTYEAGVDVAGGFLRSTGGAATVRVAAY